MTWLAWGAAACIVVRFLLDRAAAWIAEDDVVGPIPDPVPSAGLREAPTVGDLGTVRAVVAAEDIVHAAWLASQRPRH
jgi:hypothetical protein